MDFEKLFERFEKDILTEDVKSAIIEMFDKAVEKIKEDYDKKYEKLTEDVSVAMDTAFEEIKEEGKKAVIEAEKVADAEKILENFNSHIKKYHIGVEKDEKLENEYKELKESYNTLQEKNVKLESDIKDEKRKSIDNDIMNGLTAIQKDEIKIFSESMEYDDKYKEKLEKIKELITKTKVVKEEKDETSEEVINEDQDVDVSVEEVEEEEDYFI